jgi:exonuclease III
MKELRILQHNVNHGKETTLASLLREPECKEFDILAIQEPWRNPFTTTGYNTQTSGFYLAYPPFLLARVCFYINKRLDTSKWTVTNHSEDMQTLTIKTEATGTQIEEVLQIHNVYNPSPASYSSKEPGTIETLRKILETSVSETNHVVVGDFNLHHPLWCSIERLTRHAAADILLDVAHNHSLELVTPRGTVTWRARGTQSTIDLAFLSQNLVTRVQKCVPRQDLAQLSDHIPIELAVHIQIQQDVTERKRCWKKMDQEKLQETLKGQVEDTPISTNLQIDTRIHDITQALQNAIDRSTPWLQLGTNSKDYWNQDCDTATRQAKTAFHNWLREPTAYHEAQHHATRNHKIETLRRAKRDHFRSQIHEAIEERQGLGRLMKWAKERADQPQPLPQLPQLVVKDSNGQILKTATTVLEKAEVLSDKFFPRPREANLADTVGYEYPDPVTTPEEISAQEITDALRWVSPNKAPGPDAIPNKALKAAQEWLAPRLVTVFNAALRNGYHPNEWKRSVTLTLRKPKKGDYTDPKSYRPIALLNTIGKLLERVIASRISQLAETNSLLPETQMGARPGRSAETAIQMITEQVQAIWGRPGPQQVATLLSLDISGAFDHVSHERLLHNLRKRRIPEIIVRWVTSFLKDRQTKIKLPEGESGWLRTDTGIPQGSPLSPILFLFFIADLLDATNNEELRVSAVGFVDDVNILTYGRSTERNCETLSEIHRNCMQWAETHGAKFAPEKYEVLHLTRARNKFNLKATPVLEGIQINAKTHIRLLGVQIDTKLKWGPHMRAVTERASALLLATGRISSSTWGASLIKSRLLYQTIVKPAILYGAGVWYGPQGTVTASKAVDRKLETIQNQYLRKVTGAYRAVNRRILEKEADVPPITWTMNELVAKAVGRHHSTRGGRTVRQAVEKIRNRPQLSIQPRRDNVTPLERKTKWLQGKIETHLWPEYPETEGHAQKQPQHTWNRMIRELTTQGWEQQWTKYLQSVPSGKRRLLVLLDKSRNRTKLHQGFSKSMSALVTQIRTEKIGLNAFLTTMKVPGYTAACDCGWGRQTAKHIILHCPQHQTQRNKLFQDAGTRDYQKMLVTPQGAKAAATFLQATNLLPQFQLGLH